MSSALIMGRYVSLGHWVSKYDMVSLSMTLNTHASILHTPLLASYSWLTYIPHIRMLLSQCPITASSAIRLAFSHGSECQAARLGEGLPSTGNCLPTMATQQQ